MDMKEVMKRFWANCPKTKEPAIVENIAEAIQKIARLDHYLVTLDIEQISSDELDSAEQIIISMEKAGKLKCADNC